MRLLVGILLSFFAFPVHAAQEVITVLRQSSSAPTCTAPTASSFTSRWWGDNSANLCGTGHTACASGNTSMYQATDGLASNQMQNGTTADQPIWTPGDINGHASMAFNGTTMAFVATGSAYGPTYTVTATFEILAAPSVYGTVMDVSNGNGWPTQLGVINSSGVLHPVIFAGGPSTIVTGSATLALNTWYTIGWSYNSASSPYPVAIYECSGGTCTTDISTTTTATSGNGGAMYMGTQGGYYLMQSHIAEVDINSGTVLTMSQLTSVIGAWSSCQYGV